MTFKKYLVGGAVRDTLLGLQPKDRDWVVTGSTPEEMEKLGFHQVGADFPVFLHPETREEYALARTERKTGDGHKGFETFFSPDVTIEEDLKRRDLTINAIAMDDDGNIIDPYNGRKDLEAGILRAVSEAFAEDPLRILRTARFAARYDFSIETETLELCVQLGQSKEFRDLTVERVCAELLKALEEPYAEKFFRSLVEMNVLDIHFPEISNLIGQTQPEAHHPEGDAFEHTMLVLRQAVAMKLDVVRRFAALVHDFGKGVTPKDLLPKHHGHEKAGVPVVGEMCRRLRIPNKFRYAGQTAAHYHTHVHKIMEMSPSSIVRMAKGIGATHNKENVDILAMVSTCDARGRLGRENDDYPQAEYFERVMDSIFSAKFRDHYSPAEIREMSNEQRNNEQTRIWVDAAKSFVRAREGSAIQPSI